jgi:hypothetical protein
MALSCFLYCLYCLFIAYCICTAPISIVFRWFARLAMVALEAAADLVNAGKHEAARRRHAFAAAGWVTVLS